MSTTKMSHRIFAVVLAVLFLVTSLGFSGLVIWQIHKDNQAKKKTDTSSQTNSTNNTTKEGALQGTKLENFTPGGSITELKIEDITEGSGDPVKVGDTITAHYTGALVATGMIFQSSLDGGQPFTAQLVSGGLIEGWIDGIPGMKAGGKRRLTIPSAKAYKDQVKDGIPANSDLVFDVELISFKK